MLSPNYGLTAHEAAAWWRAKAVWQRDPVRQPRPRLELRPNGRGSITWSNGRVLRLRPSTPTVFAPKRSREQLPRPRRLRPTRSRSTARRNARAGPPRSEPAPPGNAKRRPGKSGVRGEHSHTSGGARDNGAKRRWQVGAP